MMPEVFRKNVPQEAPVTPDSMCLFRLGEACDHACPMCSNTGRPELRFLPEAEAFARLEHLCALGFRKVMLTGGEPTQHPVFWRITELLHERAMRWDLNTHGEPFSRPGTAERALDVGLSRAIVSLHDHEAGPSSLMSGITERKHERIVAGIDALRRVGAAVSLNRVMSRVNAGRLGDYLRFVALRWGPDLPVKVSFPSTAGKGGSWPEIQIRYQDVVGEIRSSIRLAETLGLRLDFEATPSCIVGRADRRDLGRANWGESHYLDERDGRTVYGMRFLESMQRYYGEPCKRCVAAEGCPGLSRQYILAYGAEELSPFSPR